MVCLAYCEGSYSCGSCLRKFFETPAYADSKAPLLSWYGHVHHMHWQTPNDIKAQFGAASILPSGRAIFNIAGNKYRLVVSINYRRGIVFIKFIGTHQQYNLIDAQTI